MRLSFWHRCFGAVLALLLVAVCEAAAPVTPSFFARRDYPLLSTYIQVADTNGDGIPDLISDPTAGNKIQVLFGNGDGTFGPAGATSETGLSGVIAFVVVDINGDGIADLVVSGGLTGAAPTGVTVCLGNGDGTFQTGTFYQMEGGPSGIGNPVVGDFNSDGFLDVAVGGQNGIWLFTGKGDGTLNPGTQAVSLASFNEIGLAAADLNGDGKLDLVATLPFGGVKVGEGTGFDVLFGKGDGTFEPPQAHATPRRPNAVAVGTLANGHPGIVVADLDSSNVYVYFGTGTGNFSTPLAVPNMSSEGIAIGDLNGDGIPDLASSNGYVAFGQADSKFKTPVSYPIVDIMHQYYNLALADLRNDGRLDIVTSNYYGDSVLLNLGNGTFEDGIWTPVTGGSGCGAAADFNGDGKPDLAVITTTGFTVLLGTGNANAPFTTGASVAVPGAACLVTGDLNKDGIPDLMVAVNGSPNALLSYVGNGDGTFTLAATTQTPNSGGYVALADFNHDGKLDFATSGNLMALGNGDGTFQTPTEIVSNPPSSGFSNIAVGDIRNNGWQDIVLTNGAFGSTEYLDVLLNNGKAGGFTLVTPSFGASTNQAVLVDVNGDGYLDLVLGYTDGAAAEIYLGNGLGKFTYTITLDGPGGASNIVVSDLNGDGIPDILLNGGDSISVYTGLGGATYATPIIIGTGLDPNAVLVENLHGQKTSGTPDIVVPDGNSGVMVLTNQTKVQ